MKRILRNSLIIGLLFISQIVWSEDYVDGRLFDEFEISQWDGISAPSVSPANSGRIYYNSTSDTLKVSLNGGTYSDLVSSLTALLLDGSNSDDATGSFDFFKNLTMGASEDSKTISLYRNAQFLQFGIDQYLQGYIWFPHDVGNVFLSAGDTLYSDIFLKYNVATGIDLNGKALTTTGTGTFGSIINNGILTFNPTSEIDTPFSILNDGTNWEFWLPEGSPGDFLVMKAYDINAPGDRFKFTNEGNMWALGSGTFGFTYTGFDSEGVGAYDITFNGPVKYGGFIGWTNGVYGLAPGLEIQGDIVYYPNVFASEDLDADGAVDYGVWQIYSPNNGFGIWVNDSSCTGWPGVANDLYQVLEILGAGVVGETRVIFYSADTSSTFWTGINNGLSVEQNGEAGTNHYISRLYYKDDGGGSSGDRVLTSFSSTDSGNNEERLGAFGGEIESTSTSLGTAKNNGAIVFLPGRGSAPESSTGFVPVTSTIMTSTGDVIFGNRGADKVPGVYDRDFINQGVFHWVTTGWTRVDTGGLHYLDHNTGNTTPATLDCTEANGETYLVMWEVMATSAGTVTMSIGGVTDPYNGAVAANGTYSSIVKATGTGDLTFTPTSAFNGGIDNVSVFKITAWNKILASDGYFNNSLYTLGTSTGNTFNALNENAVLQVDGVTSLWTGTAANNNLFLGTGIAPSLTTGTVNVCIGNSAGAALTEGVSNVFIGYTAGTRNTTGRLNFFLGKEAGFYNVTGGSNICIGFDAGLGTNGNSYSGDTFIGRQSGAAVTTGSYNSGIGYYALQDLTSGTGNIAYGTLSGDKITQGNYNISIGYYGGATVGVSQTSSYSMAFGRLAHYTASNQFVLGSDGYGINDMYLGEGVTCPTPIAITVQPTGGSGTNNAGANITLAGGKGTGSSAGGSIIFATSDVLAGGTTLQSLTTKWTIPASGSLNSSMAQTTVNGLTGTAVWSMPFAGSSYKKFLVYVSGFTSAGTTITFPTSFSVQPTVYGDSTATAIAVVNTTTCVLTSVGAVSGFVVVEGY